MKVLVVLLFVVIAFVSSENCWTTNQCNFETCSNSTHVVCQGHTCTCGSGSDGTHSCHTNNDCHNHHLSDIVRCRLNHHRYVCVNDVCKCQ